MLRNMMIPGVTLVLLFMISMTSVTGGLNESQQAENTIAIYGDKIYTMAKSEDGSWSGVIEDGVVLIKDGKVVQVGLAGDIEIPEGSVIKKAAVVTPGLIDARSWCIQKTMNTSVRLPVISSGQVLLKIISLPGWLLIRLSPLLKRCVPAD